VLEAFEARAARMSVACAQNLSKFTNPEEGKCFNLILSFKLYAIVLCGWFCFLGMWWWRLEVGSGLCWLLTDLYDAFARNHLSTDMMLVAYMLEELIEDAIKNCIFFCSFCLYRWQANVKVILILIIKWHILKAQKLKKK